MSSPEHAVEGHNRMMLKIANFVWAENAEEQRKNLNPIEQRQLIQMRLAVWFFQHVKNVEISKDYFLQNKDQLRDKIMYLWGSDSGCENKNYSKLYRELEDSEWFKNHPDLKGDIFKIKIEHLLKFLELKKQGLAS